MRDFALEVYFSRWEHFARHHLAASDSETQTLPDLLAMADADERREWETLRLGYTDPRGSAALRSAIADGYAHADAEKVLCFSGAQEGIHTAMHALLSRDDHAIIVVPNYQSAETIPSGLCAVTGAMLDPAEGWSLDIDSVAAAIRPNTKLIAINFPNNPTGKILERDRLEALVRLCRRYGIWLFSDEVYRLIERDPAARLPPAVDAYERGISLGTISKAYGLPGLRIGWIACRDSALLQRMERVKHYLSICNAAPCELLARIALRAGELILDRNRRIAAANIGVLDKFFATRAELFDWQSPDGGVVGFPRYKGTEGVDAFCERMIERQGVLLLPASVYQSALRPVPQDRFRIGFGRRDMPEAVAALREGLEGPGDCRFSGSYFVPGAMPSA
jgi:aspartate/methionine/tyrosine aminotransferase